jgi:CBS domain-containing protein
VNVIEAREFLRGLPPFDLLDEDELARLADAATPQHFALGDTLLHRWQTPSWLYVVTAGLIEEMDTSGPVASYSRGSCFDAKGLLAGRSENGFVSRSDSTCLLVPAPMFVALTRNNSAFRQFFTRELERKLDTMVAVQQQREAAALLLSRIGDLQLHPPVFVGPEMTLRQSAQAMHDHSASALLVRAGDRVGIFTERDLRERSILMGLDDSTAIGEFASYELHTLERDDFVFNALMLMTRHSIRHVVVTNRGAVEGLFEQRDLLELLSGSSFAIASRIERARGDDDLRDAADALPQLIRSLHERGVKPRYIARLVTDLNEKLFRRVYDSVMPADIRDSACLIVMGSEGRGEQLLRTDQDNGLILATEDEGETLAPVTKAFTETLIRLGYPPCDGGVMLSNPEWRKSIAAYELDLRSWISQPSGDAFLNLAILYDARAVAGNGNHLALLKSEMFRMLGGEQAFAGHFARAMLSFPTPLGFFNRVTVERSGAHAGALDIKKGGIFPIVHGVRSLALEFRLEETNTISRIQAMIGRGPFSEAFTADVIEAFDFMSMLRLRRQLAQWERREPIDNFVDVAGLNKLERNLLRDSLKVVRAFKSYVSHHFRLQMLS